MDVETHESEEVARSNGSYYQIERFVAEETVDGKGTTGKGRFTFGECPNADGRFDGGAVDRGNSQLCGYSDGTD